MSAIRYFNAIALCACSLLGQHVRAQDTPTPDDPPQTAGEHPVIGPLVAEIDQVLLRAIFLRDEINASGCSTPFIDALWAQILAINGLQAQAILRQDVDTIVRLTNVLENLVEDLENEIMHAMLDCEFGEFDEEENMPVPVPVPDPDVNDLQAYATCCSTSCNGLLRFLFLSHDSVPLSSLP